LAALYQELQALDQRVEQRTAEIIALFRADGACQGIGRSKAPAPRPPRRSY